ncbi:MAG: SMC-Scp complex subunit ScpB [Candidatus Omnitrophica bacterium]|nr:SMC-Scp complex subunit ScpB [Candidatus Omnitrophota bacterium]MDD5553575.1 SMC-Scp complex subunit ScpB [Candidatus Omnitrophota bacterium]
MTEDNVKSVIEALLFASEKPLMLEQFRDVLDNMPTDEVRKRIEELKEEYDKTGRGMRITEIAGGFQMITAPVFAAFLRKLFKQRKAERLSTPALETLAIIAYKQPVTRLEIESIRNVNVDNMIKVFVDKGLIRVTGRKKAPGRPRVYGTTRQFLEHFGLKSLDELPKIEGFLKPEAVGEKIETPAPEDTSGILAQKEGINEPQQPAQES